MDYTKFVNGNPINAAQINGNQDIATLSTGGVGLHYPLRYYAGETYGRTAISANTITLNRVYFLPFHVHILSLYDRLAVCGGTASATMVMRLGIYDNDPLTGQPNVLVVDAGQTAAMSTASSQYSVSISTWLPPGTYWLAAVAQTSSNAAYVGAPTPSTTVGGTAAFGYAAGYQANLPNPEVISTATTYSGALPSSFAGGISYDSTVRSPIVFIRKA